jgi:hypothetical protein
MSSWNTRVLALTTTHALALVVAAGTLAGCGGGGGRRQPAEPSEIHSAHAADSHEHGEKRNDDTARWERLGERTVDGKVDKDTIVVGREDGRFSEIQLKVEGSSLEMFELLVTFGDGTTVSPGTRLVFHNGATSRVIDLPGAKRTIKKVEFKYGNLPGGGRARVELWAR